MKKRNKKWAKEKEFLRLKRELQKNSDSQRNLGWIELEEPIFIGWKAKIEPRKDIQNREDSWIFWKICENFSTGVFSKRIKDFDWNRKKPVNQWNVQRPPHVKCINDSVYDNLPPQVQKYFTEDHYLSKEYRYRFGTWYSCNIPDFFWEIVYVKEYKTKVRVLDEILLQEEDDIEKEIYQNHYWEYKWYKGAPKHFRRTLNRIQRAKLKSDLKNQLNDGDSYITPNYKNAKWLWW
jgi:hypothetical protein